jgi:hypothetical protein
MKASKKEEECQTYPGLLMQLGINRDPMLQGNTRKWEGIDPRQGTLELDLELRLNGTIVCVRMDVESVAMASLVLLRYDVEPGGR